MNNWNYHVKDNIQSSKGYHYEKQHIANTQSEAIVKLDDDGAPV